MMRITDTNYEAIVMQVEETDEQFGNISDWPEWKVEEHFNEMMRCIKEYDFEKESTFKHEPLWLDGEITSRDDDDEELQAYFTYHNDGDRGRIDYYEIGSKYRK